MSDHTHPPRPGEELPHEALSAYLHAHIPGFRELTAVQQFPGGYSNLTYLLATNLGELVLRRPPAGTHGKSAHDMGREYEVLRRLEGVYHRVPRPLVYCSDPQVLGAPFFVMERVAGLILRNRPPQGLRLGPAEMQAISQAAIDNLAALHQIDLDATGLAELGKPVGYVERQVSGWIDRYRRAQTDDIPAMDELAHWMSQHLPTEASPALLHNDYKYDNLVLDSAPPHGIRAVLDWEMATTGDPRMDLGTTLAYWGQAGEVEAFPLAAANLTWLPGNLSRAQLADRYGQTTGADLRELPFFYVYGVFKVGVILQQIYARWKQGLTQDPRFGMLIHGVHYFGQLGRQALEKDGI